MDGNGRLGRLMIPLILVAANVLSEPLLYLSVFFKKHRQVYYDHLQQVRLSGDWENWLLFFVDAMAETATQAFHTAQQLNALRDTHRAQIASLGRMAPSTQQVLDVLFEYPIANISTLVKHSGITAATAGKVMDKLAQPELALVRELTGQKRNRIFAYSAYIDILNQE
jgi:Fic family protein